VSERRTWRKGPVGFWIRITLLSFIVLLNVADLVLPYLRGDDPIPAAPAITVSGLDGSPFVTARHPIGPLDPSGHALTHRPSGGLDITGAAYDDPSTGTQPMALPGVPFTFLVPETWACETTLVKPTSTGYHCANRVTAAGAPVLDLEVERCPASCAGAERAVVEAQLRRRVHGYWWDQYASLDDQVVNGRYYLTVVDLFTVSTDEPLGWILAIQADSTPPDAAIIQCIVNDIYNQTRA
jgi:hypothetical protein